MPVLNDIKEHRFDFRKDQTITCEIEDIRLVQGEYYIGVELGIYNNKKEWLDFVDNAISFQVDIGKYLNGIEILPGQGYIAQKANWTVV